MGAKTIHSPKKAIEFGRSIVFTHSFSRGIILRKCVTQVVGNYAGGSCPPGLVQVLFLRTCGLVHMQEDHKLEGRILFLVP